MRAVLSVSDKNGIVELARSLRDRGVEIVSTGGTAAVLSGAGLDVTAVSDVTGFPEIMDGRVKTLHPAIHGGLLARRDNPVHVAQLSEHDITPIDLLVANLYPFESTAGRSDASDSDVLEQIDIGGPAMVRAAAKNFDHVWVLTSPADYPAVLDAIDHPDVDHSALRRQLAARAFAHVSTYDSMISAWLRNGDDPRPIERTIALRLHAGLKYGENPHQSAAAYRRLSPDAPIRGILDAEQLAGDALSFNNLLDLDAAWQAVQPFGEPAAAIVKHMVPCGLAIGTTIADAYRAAFAGDTVSAFGGIVALNRTVDLDSAAAMRTLKLDAIIAPDYQADALHRLRRKKGTRILRLGVDLSASDVPPSEDIRAIAGGLLIQNADTWDDPERWRVVTSVQPTDEQWGDLRFAWTAARFVKSNAIVFARHRAIVGLGAGQPNRLESVGIAARKAESRARGAVMASDAFFPFADGIQTAIDHGIAAVIQPGGSMRDDEVVAAAETAGIAMVFTGMRHFRH